MSRHLGFHNLPYMAHRKSMKKGFRFTLMVVGKEKSAVRMKEEMYIITTLQVSLVLANPLWYSHFLAVRLLHLLVILESLFLFLFLIFYSSFIYSLYIFSPFPFSCNTQHQTHHNHRDCHGRHWAFWWPKRCQNETHCHRYSWIRWIHWQLRLVHMIYICNNKKTIFMPMHACMHAFMQTVTPQDFMNVH